MLIALNSQKYKRKLQIHFYKQLKVQLKLNYTKLTMILKAKLIELGKNNNPRKE